MSSISLFSLSITDWQNPQGSKLQSASGNKEQTNPFEQLISLLAGANNNATQKSSGIISASSMNHAVLGANVGDGMVGKDAASSAMDFFNQLFAALESIQQIGGQHRHLATDDDASETQDAQMAQGGAGVSAGIADSITPNVISI